MYFGDVWKMCGKWDYYLKHFMVHSQIVSVLIVVFRIIILKFRKDVKVSTFFMSHCKPFPHPEAFRSLLAVFLFHIKIICNSIMKIKSKSVSSILCRSQHVNCEKYNISVNDVLKNLKNLYKVLCKYLHKYLHNICYCKFC